MSVKIGEGQRGFAPLPLPNFHQIPQQPLQK